MTGTRIPIPASQPRTPRHAGPPMPALYLQHERTLLATISFIAFLVLWEVGSRTGFVDSFFFSSPTQVGAAAVAELRNPRFWDDFRVSGVEFVVGYGIAVALAVPLGLAAGWYTKLHYLLDPWLNFMNALPRVALMPLIVLWVGIGIWSKVIVVFLGVFFALLINTIRGARSVDAQLVTVASSFNASDRRMFTTLILPSSVPFIVAGLRLGIGRGLIGVVVGELYSSNAGLGHMITVAGNTLQTERLLFGVMLFTAFGICGAALLGRLERRLERWRPARRPH